MDFIIIKFFIYAVGGYIVEVIYCSIPQRKFINRGMLNGPYVPIYGFGAMLIIFFLHMVPTNNIYIIFTVSIILTSILEYITSYALEMLFHISLWNYSRYKLNINGRVCALNSILFGVLSLLLVYIIDPNMNKLFDLLNPTAQSIISHIIVIVIVFDTTISINKLYDIRKRLEILKHKMENKREVERDLHELRIKIRGLVKVHPSLISRRYPNILKDLKKVVKNARVK